MSRNSDRDVSAGPPPSPTPTKQPDPGDTDGGGCTGVGENGFHETQGGQRDYRNFWDFFNAGQNGAVPFPNISGVLARYRTCGDGDGPSDMRGNLP